MEGILRRVPAPTAEMLAEALRPLTEDPRQAAVFCDIDGTLAPIVRRAHDAKVDERASRLLGAIARRYRCAACISGRPAAEARRLVGVGGIAYAGTHGAELLLPTATAARARSRGGEVGRPRARLHRVTTTRASSGPCACGSRTRGRSWRSTGAAPPTSARPSRASSRSPSAAEEAGLHVHWGRKVLEVRPPVPIDKGRAVRELIARFPVRAAMFAGDDATDLDAFDALDELVADGTLERAVRVGISSDEGPAAIVERADLVVESVGGFQAVLEALAAA